MSAHFSLFSLTHEPWPGLKKKTESRSQRASERPLSQPATKEPAFAPWPIGLLPSVRLRLRLQRSVLLPWSYRRGHFFLGLQGRKQAQSRCSAAAEASNHVKELSCHNHSQTLTTNARKALPAVRCSTDGSLTRLLLLLYYTNKSEDSLKKSEPNKVPMGA